MAHKSISMLDQASLEQVHHESLRVLENVGVRVADPECIRILKRAGAAVDGQSEVVRLPVPMVLEALEQVTKQFELANANGDRFPMPGERPRLISRVKMPKILDYGAEIARPPSRQNVINLCQITNSLPQVEFSYAVDYPSCDVPPEIDIADTVGLAYAITGNPGVCAPLSEAAARTWIDISALAMESDDVMSDPGVLVAVCTTSPLQLEAENGALLRHAVTRGIPIAAEPMPMAGASAPFTLAGALLMDNAEALFLFTLANAIRPGAKVSYSALGSIMNMQNANISMGSPETMLLASAETAMARFYGMSTYRPACYSDSYYPDVQAGIEKTAYTLMTMLSGADLILMGGSLNNADILTYEQVVIDHDVWELVDRCVHEIAVSKETLAYETIVQAGVGGSFLGSEHTIRWLRSGEHYYGGSYNRSGQSGEESSMLARTHQRVQRILGQPLAFATPPAAVERIKQYVRDEAKSLGVNIPEWTSE